MRKDSRSKLQSKSVKGEPSHLSHALSQLIMLKGLARVRSENQTQEIWIKVCDPEYARQTRAIGIKAGVLNVAVASSALLGELVSFHKETILQQLQEQAPHLRIKDLKFKIQGDLFQHEGRQST